MKNVNYIICPICGKHKFPEWEDCGINMCPHCGWWHDTLSEENRAVAVGPNALSLENHKLRYEYYTERNPDYHYLKDGYPYIPQVEKMKCPVCGKFEFQPLSWDDIYCGDTPDDCFCISCGWRYDLNQAENHNLRMGANELSVNEYRIWYNKKLAENPDYDYSTEAIESYIPTPHKCPICGKYEFYDIGCFDICPYCGWEDDAAQLNDPNYSGSANDLSLNEYRIRYKQLIAENPDYKWNNDI